MRDYTSELKEYFKRRKFVADKQGSPLYPFDFQVITANYLLNGKNVILQAPTGSGKTLAALTPYLYAKDHNLLKWDRIFYVLPMRSLASTLYHDYGVKYFGNSSALQIGGDANDEKFEKRVIFCTIDQLLGGYLTLPIGISEAQSNIRAGALIGSLIVLDEVHLLEPRNSLRTVLHMGKTLKEYSTFLLMTATLSRSSIKFLKDWFEAEIVEVNENDLAKIPSQSNKDRKFHWAGKILTADDIISKHKTRSIVVCNTVDRAQEIYRELKDKVKDTELILLHSRFYKQDRQDKEKKLLDIFGKGAKDKDKSAILVATQVIEVGLDISAENLHSELAPANSLIQRAGRCARWENMCGDVYIYDLPQNKQGNKNYYPYDEMLKEIENETIGFITAHEANFTFSTELDFIEKTLNETEKRILDEIRLPNDEVIQCWINGDLSLSNQLIRDADSKAIILTDEPEKIRWEDNPLVISIPSVSLYRLKDSFIPGKIKGYRGGDDEEQGGWEPIQEFEQLNYEWLLALPHEFASYNEEFGLTLGVPGEPQKVIYMGQKEEKKPYSYQTEYYDEHANKTTEIGMKLLEENPVAFEIICRKTGITKDNFKEIMRLLFWYHDVGKCSFIWQKKARDYMDKRGYSYDKTKQLVHIHYNPDDEEDKRNKPHFPSHSPEGTVWVFKNLAKELKKAGANMDIAKSFLLSILRHHGGHTKLESKDTHIISYPGYSQLNIELSDYLYSSKYLLGRGDENAFPFYFYMVRILRLADQKALQEK